jgi:4-hydroxy-4-methyl-2-oxoglutarate aldolase
MAINLAEPGDVLVVAAGGSEQVSCFGDGTARRMMLKGMEGVVIDGCTRDARWLRELAFPTFCRGITPRNFHYPQDVHHGSVNVPVVCAGAAVSPGDLILGDDDGVVVVPLEIADDIASDLLRHLETERAQRSAMSAFEPFPVEEELRQRGYRFE